MPLQADLDPGLRRGIYGRLKTLQRERRRRDGFDGERDKRKLIVVSGYSVGFQLAAFSAAVDDGPVSARARPYGDRLHGAVAIGFAVAGNLIYMPAPQAPRAVIAVRGPVSFRGHGPRAAYAMEPFRRTITPIPVPGMVSQRSLSSVFEREAPRSRRRNDPLRAVIVVT